MEINKLPANNSEFIIFKTKDEKISVNVLFENDTVWLTQKQLAEIFDTTKQNIGQHVRNILEEGELVRNSVVKFFFTTAADGKKYNTEHYNLDMIISLGYRVNSKVATLFRIWATEKLHGFLTLNERTILMDAGKISHELAKQHAEKEYEIFRVKQAQIPYNTDFEKFIDQIEP